MEDYSNLSKLDRDNESTNLINEGGEVKDPRALLERMKYISDLIAKVNPIYQFRSFNYLILYREL